MSYFFCRGNQLFVLSITCCLLFSCVTPRPSIKANYQINRVGGIYAMSGHIFAKNLSEDNSLLSTKNDEIVFLLYQTNWKSAILKHSMEVLLDSVNRVCAFGTEFYLNPRDTCIVLMVEKDSEISLDSINKKVCYRLEELIKKEKRSDFTGISGILGDEDLIGISKFTLYPNSQQRFSFEGINLFDKYKYLVDLNFTPIETDKSDSNTIQDTNHIPIPFQKGTIINETGLDGCGFLIKLDNGKILEPDTLKPEFCRQGILVLVKYEPKEGASICMRGQVIKILGIKKRRPDAHE